MGECYIADGRNSDGTWIRTQLPGIGYGWVSAAYVIVDGDIEDLSFARPISTAIPTRPTPTITRRPTAISQITPAAPSSGGNCHPSYPGVCIPPPPPDLDCGEIPFRNFRVAGSDPHGFDGDNDGIGCET
jgi:hypothetical protein